ncbi:MAG: arabinose isomerase [Fimbriimonadales bacterium]
MVNVGLVGIGLETYWSQFEGLYDRLRGYQNQIAARIESFGAEVVDAGFADSPPKSHAAAEHLRREGVEVIFLYVSTYALSSTVLPLAQGVGVPVIVLNLQPVAAIDYEAFNALGDRGLMTGEWLAHCQACCVPEIASVFNRARIPYHLVTGHFQSEDSWNEVRSWTEAAGVRAAMRRCRTGVLGHYYCGMLDVYSDLTQLSTAFGTHFELLEMAELRALRSQVTDDGIKRKIEEFRGTFEVSPDCSDPELARAAKTACALDDLVANHDLGALAYYYEGTPGDEDQDIVTSIIAGNSLLTARHIPVAGECEVKNVLAMKIMDSFEAGGSFSEFYLMDYEDDVVLMGHDGPAHFAIAEGRVGLVPVPVYHGKPGQGLSIQMTVRHGPVTLLSILQGADGGVSFLVAEGASVAGPVLQIGNTNSRYRFPIGAKAFVETWSKAGPAHHCAIGVGHIADKLQNLAALLGLPCQRVC